MKFYGRGTAFVAKAPDQYPAICLRSDTWNDYGFRTYFHVDYYDQNGHKTELGFIRILKRGEASTYLNDEFDFLTENYCSIGSISYYKGLDKISKQTFNEVLTALNDCVFDKAIYNDFKNEKGFRDSLNRDGAYRSTKKWFEEFQQNITRDNRDFKFAFHTPVGKDDVGEIDAEFDFSPFIDEMTNKEVKIPNRVNLLVGKNGCGKTSCLSKLASYFAKIDGTDKQKIEGYSLPFDKVLVISYSLFDCFAKPFEMIRDNSEKENEIDEIDEISRKINNYVYCGLIGDKGIMSIDDMERNFTKAYKLIKEKDREDFWTEQVEILLSESFECSSLELKSLTNSDYKNLSLSSGQYFLFSIISEIIANIEDNSILIIDEPEMHLHPNAVSNLLKIIYKILEEYDSYAIMATHSPIILQEVPKKYIANMIRDENDSFTVKVPIETFGNEISSIVDTIFDVDIIHSNYKSVFEDLVRITSKPNDPYKTINEYFNNELSLQAKVFLKSIVFNGGDDNYASID